MIDKHLKAIARLAPLAAGFALALSAQGAAQAQAVQDFQLPPSTPSPRATAAGPVDPENPTAVPPTRAAPSPTPPPTIVQPRAEASTPPAPRASERPSPGTGTTIAPSRAPTERATPTPAPAGVEQPQITTTGAAPAPAPTASAPLAAESSAPAETAPVATTSDSTPWPWIGGGALLVLAAGGLLYRRAQSPADETESKEAPAEAPTRPEPSPPAVLPRPQELNQAPPPPPAPPPEPGPPAIAAGPLEMQFEARHLSRHMVNAALAYRLTLTNRADSATGPLRLTGDIVSAHSSLSAAEQLLPADAALAPLHEVPSLAPGESASLSGELRMPIASILPIRSGAARVFVPLARFRAEAGNGTTATRVFVVGQASEQPGGALRPFPLDRGPGVDRGLGQRELGVPA